MGTLRLGALGSASRFLVASSVFLVVAFGLGWHLGSERIWRASEQRCFAVSNEMVRSGDWLEPRMSAGGPVRLHKPPLYYWAATASATLAGGPSVVTLRSVSVLASLGSALIVFLWGCSIGGFACGVASTFVLAGTALFIVRARYGDAEPLLAFTTTLALCLFERLWRTRDSRLLPALAAVVALAFLTKATAALLTIFAPIAVWLALHRALHLALRPSVLAWATVSAIAGIAWYAAIVVSVPGAFTQFVDFALVPVGWSAPPKVARHIQSWLYYLPRYPAQTLPASVLLPWMIVEAVKTRGWRDDPRLRFVAISFAAIFLAWTLVPQKQMHYLLPLTPLYALLCGHQIATWLSRRPLSSTT